MLSPHSGNAGISTFWRKSGSEIQDHPWCSFCELSDNFFAQGKTVEFTSMNLNGEFVLNVHGATCVDNVAQMFCLGQPSLSHGGTLNEKGHGLKLFQAKFGADVLVCIRKETELSKAKRHHNISEAPEFEYILVRHGRRHDESGTTANTEIRNTYACVDIETNTIICKTGDTQAAKLAAIGLFLNNPLCTHQDNVQSNAQSVINHFSSFPQDELDYVSFLYWGFNEPYLSCNPPTLTTSKDDILLDGVSIHTVFNHMYTNLHQAVPNMIVNGNYVKLNIYKKLNFENFKEYVCEIEGQRVPFWLSGSWNADYLTNFTSKSMMNIEECGTKLFFHGRCCSPDLHFFRNLYDMKLKNKPEFLSHNDGYCESTRGGGPEQIISRGYNIFRKHLQQDPPFTIEELKTRYLKFEKIYKSAAFHSMFGLPASFIVSCSQFKMDTSKSTISSTLQNNCDIIELLKAIRFAQVQWCTDNLDDLLCFVPEKEEVASDTVDQEEFDEEDDEEDDEVKAEVVDFTTPISHSNRKRKSVETFTIVHATPKKRKPKTTVTELKKKIKDLCKKFKKTPYAWKADSFDDVLDAFNELV